MGLIGDFVEPEFYIFPDKVFSEFIAGDSYQDYFALLTFIPTPFGENRGVEYGKCMAE